MTRTPTVPRAASPSAVRGPLARRRHGHGARSATPRRRRGAEASDDGRARDEGRAAAGVSRELRVLDRRLRRPTSIRAEVAARERARAARRPRRRAAEQPLRAARPSAEDGDEGDVEGARIAEGVVEVLGNGSAFLRVDPPEPSDDDVYISAAQVRRCELVSGDSVTGPVRTPRRSERYPSLVRIDTINGASADAVSDGARYEDLPVA